MPKTSTIRTLEQDSRDNASSAPRLRPEVGRYTEARVRTKNLVDAAEEIDHEDNEENGAEADACTATVTPAAMAVVPATATQNQQQNDNDDQH